MKIHKTLGIVLAIHVVAFTIVFAIQGCSSTTQSVPPSVAGTADNASPAVQPISSIDPSPVTTASPSPAGADLNPATTSETPTLNISSGSGLYSPTRPGTPAAAAIESSAPIANVTPVATYVVVKGDSLSKIAVKYHIARSELAKANGIKTDSTIKIGQKLMIPGKASSAGKYAPAAAATDNGAAGATYKVKAGDSLRLIAKHNGTTVTMLRSLNHLKSDNVRVGQFLKLPAGSTPAVSAPVAETAPAPDSTTTTEPAKNADGRVTHTVKAGEKLSTIAKKYGVTVGELATANNISDPSKIRAGQELVIPNGSASSVKSPPATPTETTPPPPSGDLDSGLKPTATEPPVIKVDDTSPTAPPPAPPPPTDQSGTSTTP